ncbi:hypothetical protein F8388_023863 [Cannabis sativa]|uniref:Uncharacterized protein n=1 Tax=Cannabis sativa TaxID=3483 RepID=A0A7J6EUD5_CANSA|nr:hypothetical protein F8388_023863 [Cannabis sativa]KAF4399313.1 hypothetical protein G4B88_022396 [Cannabis sativa]
MAAAEAEVEGSNSTSAATRFRLWKTEGGGGGGGGGGDGDGYEDEDCNDEVWSIEVPAMAGDVGVAHRSRVGVSDLNIGTIDWDLMGWTSQPLELKKI